MPLPEGPDIAVIVDYFAPPPIIPRARIYIPLFTDRFNRRADMSPVTVAEFTAEGTADILVTRCWGARAPYSRTTFCSSAPSFHKLYIGCWARERLLQVPIIRTVTGALSG